MPYGQYWEISVGEGLKGGQHEKVQNSGWTPLRPMVSSLYRWARLRWPFYKVPRQIWQNILNDCLPKSMRKLWCTIQFFSYSYAAQLRFDSNVKYSLTLQPWTWVLSYLSVVESMTWRIYSQVSSSMSCPACITGLKRAKLIIEHQ